MPFGNNSSAIFSPPFVLCPICGTESIKHWLTKEKNKEKFRIFKCAFCGSGFLNPPPTKEYLESIYHISGHGLMQPISFQQVMLGEAEYPNATVDAKRLIRHSVRFLETRDAHNLKALDIGSGYGFFTREALNSGFQVVAVNPGAWENKVFEEMNGFSPINSFFENVDFGREKFDLVILSQVLEHLDNPLEILKRIKSLINPTGNLSIAVPNVDSILVKLLKTKENGCLWVPEHLTYFSKKGLSILLKKAGFKINHHLLISRIPYNSVSNRLRLHGFSRKVTNFLVKIIQFIPLRILDGLGLGFVHNIWAQSL